jgi:hypothetical protein
LPVRAVIDNDIKTARRGYYELLDCSMCVPATGLTARNVVQIIDASNCERNVVAALYEGQIASRVIYPWKVDYAARPMHGL